MTHHATYSTYPTTDGPWTDKDGWTLTPPDDGGAA